MGPLLLHITNPGAFTCIYHWVVGSPHFLCEKSQMPLYTINYIIVTSMRPLKCNVKKKCLHITLHVNEPWSISYSITAMIPYISQALIAVPPFLCEKIIQWPLYITVQFMSHIIEKSHGIIDIYVIVPQYVIGPNDFPVIHFKRPLWPCHWNV